MTGNVEKLKGLHQIDTAPCRSASDGNRTRTGIAAHRILSPACLPIPPPKQTVCKNKGIFSNCKMTDEESNLEQRDVQQVIPDTI